MSTIFSLALHTNGLLVSVQKQLISHLSPTLAEKVISINERGLTSADWEVYNNTRNAPGTALYLHRTSPLRPMHAAS